MKIKIIATKQNRLDKTIHLQLYKLTRNKIEHFIQTQGVILNNKKIYKPAYKVKTGDIILINWILEQPELKPNPNIKIDIVFENNDFIVINKPANLTVHPLRISDTNTLVNGLLAYYPAIRNVGDNILRPGIVHRLDKNTSGIMIIAKNNKTFQKLKTMFQKHLIQKTYIALIYGKMPQKTGTINLAITRSKQKFNRRKIDLKNNNISHQAITRYKVIKEFKNTSLLEIYPETGKTHQIRVHFASLSHFIIGDKEYGSKKINKLFPIKRQFLHAQSLEFCWEKEKMVFKSTLPKELQKCLEYDNL